MCTYPQSEHTLPHWKFVLRFCSECPQRVGRQIGRASCRVSVIPHSQHNTAIHIFSLKVHVQTEDMCTLQPFQYHMIWHKYDVYVVSRYCFMSYKCGVLFHQTLCFGISAFIFQFFKYLSFQDSNYECIILAEMQQSRPHMTL